MVVPPPLTAGSPTVCNRVATPNPESTPLLLADAGVLTVALPVEVAEPLAPPLLADPDEVPVEICTPWDADGTSAHCGELANVGPELARTAIVPKAPRPATIEDATRARLIIDCMRKYFSS